jgi:hypothetical protein
VGIYGQDWASYQSATPDTSGLSFAFVKVTEGLSYVNPKWVSQRDHAKADGLVWGGYAYPHMANDPRAEADFFLSQVAWKPGDMAVLDWEGYDQANQGVSNATKRTYKDAWLRYVKSRLPNNPVGLYVNTDYWLNLDTSSYYADFLWIADYAHPAGQPGIQAPWLFHQYSAATVDKDYCPLASTSALRSWTLSFQPTPSPPPTPPEDDMPQQLTGTVVPGSAATVVLPPCGAAWTQYPNRRLHLGFDQIGVPDATAQVRVAFHDGAAWSTPQTVTVTAAGGRVDVDMASTAQKVSLHTTSTGVAYAIESW